MNIYDLKVVMICIVLVQNTTLAEKPINQRLFKKKVTPTLHNRRAYEPKRNPSYNPNYGYEPYWPGGEWVFVDAKTTTEKGGKYACEYDCPDIYIEYGEVCGRNLTYAHKTFHNYCDLLSEDCTGRAKWMIAYRGKCQDSLKTYAKKHSIMVSKAEQYLLEFDIRNPVKRTRYPDFGKGYRPSTTSGYSNVPGYRPR